MDDDLIRRDMIALERQLRELEQTIANWERALAFNLLLERVESLAGDKYVTRLLDALYPPPYQPPTTHELESVREQKNGKIVVTYVPK